MHNELTDANGNWMEQQCNRDIEVLPSAVRSQTMVSAAQINLNHRGLVIYLNITKSSGSGGLQIAVQGQDLVSGNWMSLMAATTLVDATGIYNYGFYPGITSGGNQAINAVLPKTWRILVMHQDASEYTYSVSASLIL